MAWICARDFNCIYCIDTICILVLSIYCKYIFLLMPNTPLINIPKIQILPIRLIIKRMQQPRIRNINPLRAQNLLLGLILPDEIKPQEDHTHSHHGITR